MMIYEPIITLLLFLFSLQNGVNSFTIYDARLGNSSTSPTSSGTVEILTYRGWMPLCTRGWDWYSSESRVLCHQLGYSYSTYSENSLSAPTLQYSFYCSGSESSISQCSYYFIDERTYCSYSITLSCVSCINGSVQLRGGDVPEEGTVEYCTDGTWKAVCDNNWDYKVAFVVCRQLGLPATGAYVYYSSVHLFPLGSYFNCFGNETSLSGCRSTTSSSCDSNNVAGVRCRGDVITDLCIDGHFRLAGGKNMNEGRVEICSNGVWGTVYGQYWDSLDATVVCRQFGLYQTYSRVEVYRSSYYFGAGTGPILYTYLNCDGTESRLADCRTSSSFVFGASHFSDAGVRCQRPATTIRSDCVNGDVRLVNGSTLYEGRVEICYDGVWGSVCGIGWDNRDAAIVCLQIGFQGTNATALIYSESYFGDGEGPYHLSGLNCRGDERTLLNCTRASSTIGYHTCSPGNDAGVRCDASLCSHGEVRLFGGNRGQYGIAEVCINGLWADICSYGSSSTSATIARAFCMQHLGLQSVSFGTQSCCSGISRRNTGNLTLYNVTCTSQTGIFIQDCTYSIIPGYSTGSCNLRREMIVGCYEAANCNTGDIRLVDGNSTFEGRVEVCTQGLWGAISLYYHWNNAIVICRQLGYPWEWALIDTTNLFGQGTSRVVARVGCTGAEMQLSSCYNRTVSLSSGTRYQTNTPIGVICQGINTSRLTECSNGDVRLVDGHKETEGRVEVCAYGHWAIVCDRSWDNYKTLLLCQQLGLPTETSEYLPGNPFGTNYQLPLVGLQCFGAKNINECLISNQTSYCNHRRTVGVFCKDQRVYYEVAIHASPIQMSHAIGSRVLLNCTATPSPQNYGNFTFPLTYRWYFSASFYSNYGSTSAITIHDALNEQSFGYCLIYRNNFLLGQGRTVITTKGILEPSMNMSSPVKIQALQGQRAIVLQIYNTSNNNQLLELIWYHNGSKIVYGDDPRLSLSNDNKTLTIFNFSSNYSGIYKAQFDRLLVSPSDEDNYCEAEVLSLARHYPILKPVVFCVNMDSDCSDATVETQVRKISIRSADSTLQGTLDHLSLTVDATVLSRKELEYSSIYWYRNGRQIYTTSNLQRHYNNLSLSQAFQQFSASYEHSGRYEVQLSVNMYTYLQAGGTACLPYYNTFVSRYLGSTVTLAKEFIDIDYYEDLTLDVNKKATTRDDGVTITCQASILFPPFSMLTLIKNRQALSSSIDGLLQINTKSVERNPFGLYTCQLNASGAIFQKSYVLKEQATLRMTIDSSNSSICSNSEMVATKYVETTLIEKIKRECQCNFNPDGFQNSTINCESSSELVYMTTLEYSNDEGSETASVIAKRLVGQAPFSMAAGGTQLTVKSACSDCEMPTAKAMLSPSVGGGLFIGGHTCFMAIVAMKKCARSEGKGERRVEVKTDPLRYTSAGTAYQDASFKEPAADYMTPNPKKPSEYQAMGPRDQPTEYETMQIGEQPIYEETF